MIGFLGLVGFVLKDYLPDLLPRLTGNLVSEEINAEAPGSQNPSTSSSQADATKTTEAATSPSAPGSGVVSVSKQETPPAKSSSFNPTEPAPVQETRTSSLTETAPVMHMNEPQSDQKGSVAQTNQVPKTTVTPNALLEISSKPVTNGATLGTPPTAALEDTVGTRSIAEDDAPPEARPAVEALRKFLAASSLSERLLHTLGEEHMKPLMERYYSRMADGPVNVDRIQFVRMDPNPELGSGRHCIFSLENKAWEFPVPVMLEEQTDGFKVDWLAFVEFKDRLLEKFFQSYQEGPARFHVGIIRHHFFEDGVPNVDGKDAFRVMPAPPNPFQSSVFLDKNSALAQELRSRLPWETHVWAVVELEWKKIGSQQWVELSAVPQMHWYSLPTAPRPISTKQKAPESEDLPPGITKNGARSQSGGKSGTGGNMPPPGIRKSSPELPATLKRPIPAGR